MALTNRAASAGRLFSLVLSVWALIGHAVAAPPEVPRKTAFSTDLTDTWFNPSEPGWGMQATQTGNFIFLTVYAYGPDTRPMWFGGGVTSSNGAKFTGKLYVTSGPYFGGDFDPSSVTVREAGTMTFEATSVDTAKFTYTFDGVTVSKTVQRQPLTLDDYTGAYVSALTQTVTGCNETSTTGNGVFSGLVIFQFAQAGTSMTLVVSSGSGSSCSASGTYSQVGRDGRFDGPYTCTSGEVGNAVIYEMSNRVRQFAARTVFQSTNQGCLSLGRITGVIPDAPPAAAPASAQ